MLATLHRTRLCLDRPFAIARVYACRCGRPIFFRDSFCLSCKTVLGYEPSLSRICPLSAGPEPGTWTIGGTSPGDKRLYGLCANHASPASCNWLTRVDFGKNNLCICCRLNRTIPNLSDPENAENWRRIEFAKRRLVSSLLSLGLPVEPLSETGDGGLAFDFLRTPSQGPRVLTGHSCGVITLNIEEADDSMRESIRKRLHEPYRTLLGHLRHEVGHYYWDRLLAGTSLIEEFRELFGDERQDYAEALRLHYRQGPPADWRGRFISAYASSHPWEDWAETWAHYLHMADALDTASSFSLDMESLDIPFECFQPDALCQPDDRFLHFANAWIRLTAVLNELSCSMGLPDFYPFEISRSVVGKLHFIHKTIEALPAPRTTNNILPWKVLRG
jgi:hypothetical protein